MPAITRQHHATYHTRTVAELIADLQQFPPDTPVLALWDSCYWTVGSVELDQGLTPPALILDADAANN